MNTKKYELTLRTDGEKNQGTEREKVSPGSGSHKTYDLTIYTYDRETQRHESEEVYLDSMEDVKAKIDSMKDDRRIRFMELYTYNAADDCYDFNERYERPDRLSAGEAEAITDDLRALRTYCDISATEAKLGHNGEVADIFLRDVETLDTVLDLLEVLI